MSQFKIMQIEHLTILYIFTPQVPCPVGWGCRIHRLHLYRGVRHPRVSYWLSRLGLYDTPTASLPRRKTPAHECPGYDTKQSDGEVPVMLEFWGIQRTPSLPSFLGPLLLEVVVPDRVLSMSQIRLNCVLMLNWIVWNRTVLTFNWVWTKSILILNWVVWNRTLTKLNNLK